MGDNEIIIQVGNLRTLTIVSTETTSSVSENIYMNKKNNHDSLFIVSGNRS